MEKAKMTLTRALSEIKMLDNKIKSFNNSTKEWVTVSKNGTIKGYQDLAGFKSNVQSNKDKLEDLISRRNEIKRALIVANNTITISLGGKSYTIAEAIDRKGFLATEKATFNSINVLILKSKAVLEAEDKNLDRKIEETINRTFDGDGKKDADLIKGIEKNLRDSNKFELVDPVGIQSWIETKLEEIVNFETEIDFSLSEINSQNYVTI
jgi:hypothetical protein